MTKLNPANFLDPAPGKINFPEGFPLPTLCQRIQLMRLAAETGRKYYLNKSHQNCEFIKQGQQITLRSRHYTYSWTIKGFTPSNTFEIEKADNPSWAVAFKINDVGFCLDSTPQVDRPLMILEHGFGCQREELNNFNKRISNSERNIFGTAGWDHQQLKWYWQTKPPQQVSFQLICSSVMKALLETEEIIFFTIDSFVELTKEYVVTIFRPFDHVTLNLSLITGKSEELSKGDYPVSYSPDFQEIRQSA